MFSTLYRQELQSENGFERLPGVPCTLQAVIYSLKMASVGCHGCSLYSTGMNSHTENGVERLSGTPSTLKAGIAV